MITMTFSLPPEVQPHMEVECTLCEFTCELWEALPIDNPHKELYIGDEIPAGQCPNCEVGMMYLPEEYDD